MLPRAKKSYGQNFLVDRNVVRKVVDAAEIDPGEAVLEIGPGTGVLTEALVAAGAHVVAVEADHDLVAPLREKFGQTIELVEGDILSVGDAIARRLGQYKLVANIPYQITSAILFAFLTSSDPPSRLVLMVQREVADRIVAQPPRMSLLSVACQLYADVRKIAQVPAGAFRPAPKVESAIVRLDVRPRGASDAKEIERAISLAKVGFSARRKQLHRNLSAGGICSSDAARRALGSLGLPPTARAENLPASHWIALRRLL